MRDKLVPIFFPNIKPAVWDFLHINECVQAFAKQIQKMLIKSDKSLCIWQYTGVLKSGVYVATSPRWLSRGWCVRADGDGVGYSQSDNGGAYGVTSMLSLFV